MVPPVYLVIRKPRGLRKFQKLERTVLWRQLYSSRKGDTEFILFRFNMLLNLEFYDSYVRSVIKNLNHTNEKIIKHLERERVSRKAWKAL